MAFDRVYYYDKITHIRQLLGEIQTNFNLNLVIDGSKDSLQIDVYSFTREPMQPNTIIQHPNNPLQWFVVKKDQVKRYANEQGFYYTHSLTLNGAIDLLGSRDLIDCGFNANNYTIDTFFKKLLKLSNFEFEYEIDYGTNIDKDKKIDFIKSYENYTLLSAIRDLFNGFNCDVKMVFVVVPFVNDNSNISFKISKAIFKIIPRTGNIDLAPINISELDDIRENINFDKESFGTTVISNAQNVVSTQAKTFPQVGGVTITGENYYTSTGTAYIKLPSPAWKVNWVRAFCLRQIALYKEGSQNFTDFTGNKSYYFGNIAVKELIEGMEAEQETNPSTELEYLIDRLKSNKEEAIKYFDSVSTTFYNNPSYDHKVNYEQDYDYGTIVKEEKTPYIPVLKVIGNVTTNLYNSRQVALMDKDSVDLLKSTQISIAWERGSEKVSNLTSVFYHEDGYRVINRGWNNCDARKYQNMLYSGTNYKAYNFATYNGVKWYLIAFRNISGIYVPTQFSKTETMFQVNYIPMNDLKVKQDNESNTLDCKLYNQNGKLNDSVALSKMIDSYSKEIKNPTITRYMEYYDFANVPQVGQIVIDGNIKYVINNISYNVYPNETNIQNKVGYYIECEFTLAEYISTKSIMTSPNTNVRDYSIPQKYNIKRRQVYRDYYEFGFSIDELASQEKSYTKLEEYLPLGYYQTPFDFDHTALIKIDYENEVNGQISWYYQLNSTVYIMNKSVYEVVDFDDNNIIGYDIQNSTSGFNMSDLWSNQYRAVTTPVSYVDDYGKFVGITMQMLDKEQLQEVYSNVYTSGYVIMFSAHCFINKEIYDYSIQATTNEYQDYTEYEITQSTPEYIWTIEIEPQDLGIPNDFELTQDNFIDFVNLKVYVNAHQNNQGNVYIDNFNDNGKIVLKVEFTNPYSIFGRETGTLAIVFKMKYYNEKGGVGDYYIQELDYNKDAIEVPVFEYSLQLGDTKDVEIGDNIFKNSGIATIYSLATAPKNTITKLNASIFEPELIISGEIYNVGYYNRKAIIRVLNSPKIEINSDKIKIGVYEDAELSFIGNSTDQLFKLNDSTQNVSQIGRDDLIDKDIIVFKHTINSIKYDTVEGVTNCDYDTNIMYIIHAPQSDQFDGDDLILNINYYRLK